jgi:hypothetical protein
MKSLNKDEWAQHVQWCMESDQPRVINHHYLPEMSKMMPQVRKYVSNRQTESQQFEKLIQMWQICLPQQMSVHCSIRLGDTLWHAMGQAQQLEALVY